MDRIGADTLLLTVVGSTAYGLARPGSDVDLLGVFAAPTRDVLGLDPGAVVSTSRVSHDPDVTVHEVGKFARLCLACNPTAMEALWAPEYRVLTASGQLLLDVRESFLSTSQVRASYVGYARAQAARVAQRAADGRADRVAKHAWHCGRLLLQAAELIGTGRLTLDVSAHRDELFALGQQAVRDPSSLQDWIQPHLARLESMRSVLPDAADVAAVDDAVRQIRLAGLPRT